MKALHLRAWPLLAAVIVTFGTGCQTEPPKPVTVENTTELSATITAINLENRLVTLKGEDGSETTVEVGPEARNLSQVHVGDKVVVAYYEAIAAEFKQPGTGVQGVVYDVGSGRTKEGEKPGAAVGQQVKATVKIVSVDTKNNIVNFTGPQGMLRAVPVQDPQAREFIKKLKPGDEVEITYTEALALSIKPAT